MANTLKSSGASWLLDPFAPTDQEARSEYRLAPNRRAWLIPLALAIGLLVVSAVGWATDPERFYFAYLIGWVFCLTISLGALFFVLIHHITKAHWGIVVRRIPETLAWGFPLLAVLSIPVLIGMHDLYHWTHEELYLYGEPGYDPLLAGKRGYLNVPFWLARLAIYFGVWTFLAHRLYKLSLQQDVAPTADIPAKQRKVSAYGIPLFAVTIAFASYDLVMSLDPHWFSTIFGVYLFAGAFWSANAAIIILARVLQRNAGVLGRTITVEHYHDLGKWLFAFTVFWAYIAFSQYMLIWYADIPEETIFYAHRMEHGWGWHSAILIIFHFAIPFAVLLSRTAKRLLPLLTVMAVWALVMHWFDLHWLAMPVYDGLYGAAHGHHAGFSVWDFTCWLGLTALCASLVIYRLQRHPLVPQNDPRLARSLHFHNV